MNPQFDQVLRLGSVPYLNVRPLLRALERAYSQEGPWREAYPLGLEVCELVPRQLAARTRRGDFHGAIVPVFEHLSRPDGALFPGTCIASWGPVESVVVFSEDPLDQVRTVLLDPASLTSVNLVRVLADLSGLDVVFEEPSDDAWPPEVGTARLLIGDEALRRRGTCAMEWDLGEAWTNITGLPFVFAAWHTPFAHLAQPGTALFALFSTMAEFVDQEIDRAAELDGPRFGFSAQTARQYLRRAIHFPFGSAEQEGLNRFQSECQRLHLLPVEPAIASVP